MFIPVVSGTRAVKGEATGKPPEQELANQTAREWDPVVPETHRESPPSQLLWCDARVGMLV